MRALGHREALRLDDGYRTSGLTYRQLYQQILAFSSQLTQRKLQKGDRLLLWGENAPQWVVCFWACVSKGVQVVPVDARLSAGFVEKVISDAKAAILIHDGKVDIAPLRDKISSISFSEIRKSDRSVLTLETVEATPDDIVEIVYTSGTTGSPKAVVSRHRNLCANLGPFETEIRKYRKFAAVFQPIRILDMLPLSHMFGQALGLYLPILLEGALCLSPEMRPGAIIDTIRRNRISVLVAVPRLVEQLREFLALNYKIDLPIRYRGTIGVLEKWWKYRRIHSRLGWKFWAIVVGGAEVGRELEEFWSQPGIALIQGYGLTEASPVVSVNHPFAARKGSLGKPLKGQEVRIAPDGEILVRGENVASSYFSAGVEKEESEWLRTGDIGELDEEGRLYYRGRKKDLIVTSEGLNVFPEDVEEVINRHPAVRDSAVVALRRDGQEAVHAVLLLHDARADPNGIIRETNRQLEPDQRVRSWSIWSEDDFPRTTSTLKIRRSEVARRISDRGPDDEAGRLAGGRLERMLSRLSGIRPEGIEDATRLGEDLGLSSLDRVGLLSQLEEEYRLELDEVTFTELSTVGELRRLLAPVDIDRAGQRLAATGTNAERRVGPVRSEALRPASSHAPSPRWTRTLPVRTFRGLAHRLLILPVFRHYIPVKVVEGRDILAHIDTPVIFAANHQSHLDTIAVFAILPPDWRARLAPAIRQEYFAAWFNEGHRLTSKLWTGLEYFFASSLFNVYPIPQHMGGVGRSLQYTGELLDQGYCSLVFPEGRRTPDGRMLPFQPGIGLMAVRLQVPVIPIRLEGLFEIMPLHARWPRRGSVRVWIGQPLTFAPNVDFKKATQDVEEAMRRLGPSAVA